MSRASAAKTLSPLYAHQRTIIHQSITSGSEVLARTSKDLVLICHLDLEAGGARSVQHSM